MFLWTYMKQKKTNNKELSIIFLILLKAYIYLFICVTNKYDKTIIDWLFVSKTKLNKHQT